MSDALVKVKEQLSQLQQDVRKQRRGGKGDGKHMGRHGEGRTPDATKPEEASPKKKACFKWNATKPCANVPCPFAHICQKCGDAGHKRTDCTK